MAEPRKLFRIEQTAAVRLEDSIETSQGGLRHDEIMRELQALRVALSIAAPRRRSRTTRGEPRDVARALPLSSISSPTPSAATTIMPSMPAAAFHTRWLPPQRRARAWDTS
jgi:hypothetical protein